MKNVLITGGGFGNKGAQAMTFITISEMAICFPDHQIIVMSANDSKLMAEDDYPYNFRIVGSEMCIPHGFYLLGGLSRLYAMKHGIRRKDIIESEKIWKNTEYVIDVGGYTLGSNRKKSVNTRSCMVAALANKYGAKMIFMPQSFGPFVYEGYRGKMLENWIGKSLRKADVIYAREESGYRALHDKFQLTNVKKSPDMVLQNREIQLDKIYKKTPDFVDLQIKEHSVGIIPNTENLKYMEKKDMLSMYEAVIKELLELQYHIYIFAHSHNDIELCCDIKNLYADKDEVIELKMDLSCLEFDRNVSKFDFLIASRYHSIVHAYRRAIPCIIIGWAEKYHELASVCGQKDYVYDVREFINKIKICVCVHDMIQNLDDNRQTINNRVTKIQQESVFKIL